MEASSNSDLNCVKLLVSKGANVNARIDRGETVLMQAVNNLACLKFLISKGADINAKTDDGYTPLEGAVSVGNLQCVKFLISKGADVNADGGGALRGAQNSRNSAIASALKKAGAK